MSTGDWAGVAAGSGALVPQANTAVPTTNVNRTASQYKLRRGAWAILDDVTMLSTSMVG